MVRCGQESLIHQRDANRDERMRYGMLKDFILSEDVSSLTTSDSEVAAIWSCAIY